jgi:hypothetical protein
MMSQMRKEASPPPNKPFHRIGGKRRPPSGELHVMHSVESVILTHPKNLD